MPDEKHLEILAMASAANLSVGELAALVVAPIEPNDSLERKAALLRTKLGIAEALDERDRDAAKVDDDDDAGADDEDDDSRAKEGARRRQWTRLALIGVMEFLVSIDAGRRFGHPVTLWRLVKALNELDDSGQVSSIFSSSRTGRGARPDTLEAQGLKIAGAVAMEIAHTDCRMPLEPAQKLVARVYSPPH